ncbi:MULTISPECIES: glycoside hydrolase family 108 protein [unclassified Aurantimonas]|uniref:glycoside hydrolase family 108 protein n=1 Tax=unclassified Aurantimonas TaxID=2638230 RepID=UPI002E185E8F|nr:MULTISPECIES: glycosyl hydrolase 108 family protein [unclassified Aurantimonas]MEC5291578.1 glycosyl hydrolase 108 family protein [Aurantimonas sp. C2-3-R2]MEC5412662.1 glycosyl hydrolase 108 family protein [Aurantimonas sp. C2-4-R8]
MAANNFPACLTETLRWEGGYVNHPRDPGGHTNKGVTLATLRRYKPGASVADLKAIDRKTIERIYRDGYWDKVRGDILGRGVDLATFDYGVNSGPGTAWKKLMGVVGGSDVETVKKLCAARLRSYRSFRTWATFGRGWTRRVTAIEAKGVAWALAGEPLVKVGGAVLQNDHVIDKLGDEERKADATAKQQKGGAAASGAGGVGAGASPAVWFADGTVWIVGGVALVAIGFAVFLIWRSSVNKERAKAYARVAEEIAA